MKAQMVLLLFVLVAGLQATPSSRRDSRLGDTLGDDQVIPEEEAMKIMEEDESSEDVMPTIKPLRR